MIGWIIATMVIIWLIFWIVWGRDWLYHQPWAWSQAWFRMIEPIELWLWDKSKTILWSRFLIVLGALPPILDQLQLFNVPAVIDMISEKYRPYISLTLVLIGIVSEILRRRTTQPLALVALPEKKPLEVAAAVAESNAVKAQAVAVVQEAKKEGKV